jgi:hypothetical protein
MTPLLPQAALAAVLAAATLPAAAAAGVEWGTPASAPATALATAPVAAASAAVPAASAASATVIMLPRTPPSAFATARASNSQATGEYFRDFAELVVRVRAVKWIEEICSETFPTTAEVNRHAYADWLAAHGPFVDEVEGQFDIIGRYWGTASKAAQAEGLTVDKLKARVEANRTGLRQDFLARGMRSFQVRCEAYPEILLSPQLDLENSQAELVRSVRLGPQ